MNYQIIGKCSKCGGDVVIPTIVGYVGPIENLIRCRKCYAKKANNSPIIPMQ